MPGFMFEIRHPVGSDHFGFKRVAEVKARPISLSSTDLLINWPVAKFFLDLETPEYILAVYFYTATRKEQRFMSKQKRKGTATLAPGPEVRTTRRQMVKSLASGGLILGVSGVPLAMLAQTKPTAPARQPNPSPV